MEIVIKSVTIYCGEVVSVEVKENLAIILLENDQDIHIAPPRKKLQIRFSYWDSLRRKEMWIGESQPKWSDFRRSKKVPVYISETIIALRDENGSIYKIVVKCDY